MKNNIGIATKIKHFNELFKDKRTYEIFKAIISGILCLKKRKQGDLANFGGKTLSQIQYFFYKSNWNYNLLNLFRVNWIRNKIKGCADKRSDIVIFDGTIMAKNVKSNFSGFANWFFSNKDKKVVNGLDVFGASIITKSKIRYMLNLSIFFKKKVKNSKDKRKGSLLNEAWRKFIEKTLKNTKSWLVVIDSGFKGANICKRIFSVMKRHFLVRIDQSQLFFDKLGNRFKIEDMLKKKTTMYFENGRMWVFKDVYLNSWIKKGIKIPVTIIVYHVNGAKTPMVVATSASLEDVYENMIRKKGDLSWTEKIKQEKFDKKVIIKGNENQIYSCFVLLYRRRWSIEECFKELKSYLCFESFKVTSHESIMKYFHTILVVHTLLTIMNYCLHLNPKSFDFVYDFLKEKRNIKEKKGKHKKITIVGVKLFIEMMLQTGFVGKVRGKHKKVLAELLKNTVYPKSCLSLC